MNKYKKALLKEIMFYGWYILNEGKPNTSGGKVDRMCGIYDHLLGLFQQRKNKDKKNRKMSIIKIIELELW